MGFLLTKELFHGCRIILIIQPPTLTQRAGGECLLVRLKEKMKENLTLYEFNLMPEGEQYNIIFKKGQILDYISEGEKRIALYAVSKFFIEVEYNVIRKTLVGKKGFVNGIKLDRYSTIPKLF